MVIFHQKNKTDGFTLLEVITAVTISAAILAGMASSGWLLNRIRANPDSLDWAELTADFNRLQRLLTTMIDPPPNSPGAFRILSMNPLHIQGFCSPGGYRNSSGCGDLFLMKLKFLPGSGLMLELDGDFREDTRDLNDLMFRTALECSMQILDDSSNWLAEPDRSLLMKQPAAYRIKVTLPSSSGKLSFEQIIPAGHGRRE